MFLKCLQCDENHYNSVIGESLKHSCGETDGSMLFVIECHWLKILTLRMHRLLFLVLPAVLL